MAVAQTLEWVCLAVMTALKCQDVPTRLNVLGLPLDETIECHPIINGHLLLVLSDTPFANRASSAVHEMTLH